MSDNQGGESSSTQPGGGEYDPNSYAAYYSQFYGPEYAAYAAQYQAQMYQQAYMQQMMMGGDPYGAMRGGFGGYGRGGFGGPRGFGGGRGGGVRDEGPPGMTLWVGNLPPDVQDFEVKSAFEVYGTVEQVRLLPQKNCAFVKFVDLETAQKARDSSQSGFQIRGVSVKVGYGKNSDQPRPPSGGGGGGGFGGPQARGGYIPEDQIPPTTNLWVGNLDPNTSEEELRLYFGPFGQIDRVKVLPHRNCAFVTYAILEDALQAKKTLHGTVMRGQPMKINFGRQDAAPQGRIYGQSGTSRSALLAAASYGQQQVAEAYSSLGGGGGGGPSEKQRIDEPFTLTPPPAPEDPATKEIIDKLAGAVVKSGVGLEDKVKEKEKENPKFGFLFENSDFHDYYTWKKYDLRQQLAAEAKASAQPPPSQQQQGGGDRPPWANQGPPPVLMGGNRPQQQQGSFDGYDTNEPLQGKDEDELRELLNAIQPTQEAIKVGKNWIFDRIKKAKSIASFIMGFFGNPSLSFEGKLNVIYLISDVLHNAKKKFRQQDSSDDEISSAFKPFIGGILLSSYVNQPQENKDKINQVVSSWSEPQIFDNETMAHFQGQLNGSIPPNQPPPFRQPPQQQQHQVAPPQHNGQGSYNAVPPPSSIQVPQQQQKVLMGGIDELLSQGKSRVDQQSDDEDDGDDDGRREGRKRKREDEFDEDATRSKR